MKNQVIVFFCVVWVFWLTFIEAAGQEGPLSSLDTYKNNPAQWMKYPNTSNALYNQIALYAQALLDEKNQRISSFQSGNDWMNYRQELMKKFAQPLSGFKKHPLNASVTGTIEREDFSVEKIVYESLPGFYVTGCLFLPKTIRGRCPAVVVPTGHSQAAFRRDIYQHVILNLVKKGFVVFTFDPIGQGERVQYLDSASGQSSVGGSTAEHSYAGAQSLLVGHSLSDYFIWDGIRAIDYVVSRPEVDTTRIGMTGLSGGGTQTAFIAACDNRIRAAAPECYITSYQRLFESVGPQDAEQNLYKGLQQGIDHPGLLLMRAPKPTLIISTTRDFFSIQGARETYQQAKEGYAALGYPERIGMIEADGVHGSVRDNREGMYRFFRSALSLPGNSEDMETACFGEEQLKVSPTGQVSTSYGSKTIFDFTRDEAKKAVNDRKVKTPIELAENRDYILEKVYNLSGFDSTRQIKSVVFTGNQKEKTYVIEKYFIQGQDVSYPIPFVLIRPRTMQKGPLLLYLDASGKEEILRNEQEIRRYLEKGYAVLAPDVIGTGELKNRSYKGDSFIRDYSFNLFIGANLTGKSIAGMQASDLDLVLKSLSSLKGVDAQNITAVVKGECCSSYLHFAVFSNKIKKTIFINPLISFENVAITPDYNPRYLWTAVPEAIRYYDLFYLQSLLIPHELVVIQPVSAKGQAASEDLAGKPLTFLQEAYAAQKKDKQLKIILSTDDPAVPDWSEFLE